MNKKIDFNKLNITNEVLDKISGDTKYKDFQNRLKKIQKLRKAIYRTASIKKICCEQCSF